MDWFRWWHGSVSDPKLRVIARKSGRRLADVVAVWASILEHASSVTQCNAELTRGDVSRFDPESIDALLDLDDGAASAIFAAMADKGMVSDGRLANWETRQPKREDSSAERVRRHREKKKASGNRNESGDNETPSNADVTHCNAPEEIRGDKNIREEPNGSSCAELSVESAAPAIITLPLNKAGEHYGVTQADLDQWCNLYPAVDVMQQLRNMAGWLDSNPAKRKTKRGIKRFVNNWLARDQDRGGALQGAINGQHHRPSALEQVEAHAAATQQHGRIINGTVERTDDGGPVGEVLPNLRG